MDITHLQNFLNQKFKRVWVRPPLFLSLHPFFLKKGLYYATRNFKRVYRYFYVIWNNVFDGFRRTTMLDICPATLEQDVLQHKVNKLAQKLNDYYLTVQQNTVDIPEFMKPTEQQIQGLVNAHINQMLRDGSIDYWYFKLLEEEDNGIRR